MQNVSLRELNNIRSLNASSYKEQTCTWDDSIKVKMKKDQLEQNIPLDGEKYDVVVIGGGTAGVIAAIQAARAGAITLLVEKNMVLGGTMTAAGVAFPGLFHSHGQQIIAGIGWELVTQCVEYSGASLPNFSLPDLPHYKYQIPLDPFIYTSLCCQTVIDAGCKLLLNSMLASVKQQADCWQLELCTKTGLKTVKTQLLIDCTGDANAAMLAGAQVRVIAEPQPASLICKLSGYDFASLDIDAINQAFEQAVKAGKLAYTDVSWDSERAKVGNWLRQYGTNANHFTAHNAHTSEGRTALEIKARNSILNLYRFLKTQPGLNNLQINYIAQECGVRETVTIKGEATITVDDYLSGRRWDDAVCYSFYPIDLHGSGGVDCRQLQQGVIPTIPRGALLPHGCGNLLVAGRAISSDRLANSALRVQASSMATGQVAGALAALCVAKNQDPRNISAKLLCDLLKTHGAIVP